jgi:hypothetical protein
LRYTVGRPGYTWIMTSGLSSTNCGGGQEGEVWVCTVGVMGHGRATKVGCSRRRLEQCDGKWGGGEEGDVRACMVRVMEDRRATNVGASEGLHQKLGGGGKKR